MAQRGRLSRFLTIALILFMTPVFVFGATIAITGFVTVEVYEEDGVNLYIPVPAILLDLAILMAPLVIPDDALADAAARSSPTRRPSRPSPRSWKTVRAACWWSTAAATRSSRSRRPGAPSRSTSMPTTPRSTSRCRPG